MEIKMNALRGLDIAGKKILFRPDINSPIDPVTKKIVNENRLKKNAVTLKYMLENGAAVALIAHQGDAQLSKLDSARRTRRKAVRSDRLSGALH